MKVLIFGAGGQAKETIDLIEENIKCEILGLIDVEPSAQIYNNKYLGADEDVEIIVNKTMATHFFVAIGNPGIRKKIYHKIVKMLRPLSIVSEKANISKYCRIGNHVIIYPGSTINADVELGDDVIINSNASIGHETKIGSHVNVNPGASIGGRVIVEDLSVIGIGASIRENICIAKRCIIGGGAMVTKNTLVGKTYVGVPAKVV